ncbi:hypothetical protein [Bacillus sp. NPDC077027]|uniref:hypothetical protein n=1 Tax=Bacillus sp. NPDC077027 TaxID=3390548 RepID=UPI003CFC9657
MKKFFWSKTFLIMLSLTLVFLGTVFILSGQGFHQIWRLLIISLITASVLNGVTKWLKQQLAQMTSSS